MDPTEFLERTNNRNLKCQIGGMVEKRMREYTEDLDRRRMMLSQQLQMEALQWDEELALWLQAKAEEAEKQRHEWILLERMKREQAEVELLKLKQQQREIENSEAHRHRETKEILLETKYAQLQQIEERKALRRKEAQVQQLWHEVWQRLDATREQQAQYEQNLRHILEGNTQWENERREEEQRAQRAEETLTEQHEYAQAMELAAEVEAKRKEEALIKARNKRLQQFSDLQKQIEQNQQLAQKEAERSKSENLGYNMREDMQIYEDLQQKIYARAHNRDWHQSYLQHTAEERATERLKTLQLEKAYQGTGCVLSQKKKQPYGKEVR
ncbi:vicilin-like seed storage protein At2g18540 [Scaptodrosophila lebanonensis]|uniref:Vicilin-like seed storage protein At2g18540 n=1 Tax=Drosophila lebanonensis TaxID=7225 RepID=A0A6J2UJI9_DROLE|nr:vicilin-like seed storage protein At2g18540 [Scaptodrosophila lebanonensis]